jgi:hypothetical protein
MHIDFSLFKVARIYGRKRPVPLSNLSFDCKDKKPPFANKGITLENAGYDEHIILPPCQRWIEELIVTGL